MAATVALRAGTTNSAGEDDLISAEPGTVGEAIGEMARMLRDTRGSMLLGSAVLSAITIGIALEAVFARSAFRPGVAGLVSVAMIGVLLACWLRAVALLVLSGRPVLDELNEHRWRTGAPVDPRVRWHTAYPEAQSAVEWNWTRANMMLGAARIGRERAQLGDTWTFITTALFLVWSMAVLLGL